jgi:hypothetical protein
VYWTYEGLAQLKSLFLACESKFLKIFYCDWQLTQLNITTLRPSSEGLLFCYAAQRIDWQHYVKWLTREVAAHGDPENGGVCSSRGSDFYRLPAHARLQLTWICSSQGGTYWEILVNTGRDW